MHDLVFLLDVDNTLLNNDALKAGLDGAIRSLIGPDATREFWDVYESVRRDEEFVDFPATLTTFAQTHPSLPNQELKTLVMGISFAGYLYPRSLEAVSYLHTIGLPVILSDGDPVFQRLKIEHSGLASAVEGRVILTVHKQDEMDTVFTRFPATHYALIDDKATILADIGQRYSRLITTVLVCQGKYARLQASPKPDLVLPHIGDAVSVPREEFFEFGHASENPIA